MIDNEVGLLAKAAQRLFSKAYQDCSEVVFNFDWPSIGIFDLPALEFRGKKEFDKTETQLIAGIAAYLGIVANECWEAFAEDVKVEVGSLGVEISARANNGERAVIPIEHSLQAILSKTPSPFPVINGFLRPLADDDPFCKFICTWPNDRSLAFWLWCLGKCKHR